MKNREKYADEIKKYNGKNFCGDFIKPNILKKEKCDYRCMKCSMLQAVWLDEEYVGQEVDWSKVAVDTPILIKAYEKDEWARRYFARYENGMVMLGMLEQHLGLLLEITV